MFDWYDIDPEYMDEVIARLEEENARKEFADSWGSYERYNRSVFD